MLTAGTKLGPYEILAPLGAGGMGEVYRARDTRLDRTIAIKVLPESFAQSPERLRRFEQEARATSALNHPNILSIFDLGTHDGVPYIASELLEGSTLRERLNEGSVPLRKALDYAVQIANGLGAAHEKGITHRDLKPENLFVTKDGRVKILDFGLAKLAPPELAPGAPEDSPTITSPAGPETHPGVVLGTVGYMSPEQVRGRIADHRSDLFSLGAILYEMVSGRRAFHGESSVETMNAILKEDLPELSATDQHVPPALDRLLRRCLEKSPEERFQSARDLAFALEALSGLSGATAAQAALTSAGPRTKRWLLPVAGVAVVVLIAAAAFTAGLWKGRAAGATSVTFRPLSYRPQTIFRAAFAPDGKTIVYSAALAGNSPELFTLSPDYPEPRSMELRDAQLLSVSSRGELALLVKVSYLNHRLFQGTLASMPLGGSAAREILEGVREADWAPDGSGLAIIREVGGKDRLEYPIGKVLCETPGYFSDLRFSPAGDHIAFFEHPAKYDDRGGVAVVDLSGKKTVLAEGFWGEQGLAWTADGKEVLFSAGNSYTAFAIYAVTLSGARRLALASGGGVVIHDVSRTGQWLVTRDDDRRDMMVKAPGATAERNLSFLDYSEPAAMSSDGQVLLFTEESGVFGSNYAVCLRKTDGSPAVRLGEGGASDLSPDGKWALADIPTSPYQLVLYPTGAGEPRHLDRGEIVDFTSAQFLPDGKSVLVCGSSPGHSPRCFLEDIAGGKPRAITQEGSWQAWVSPDGKTIFVLATDGTYLQYPLEGGNPRPVPALVSGDTVIRWSSDGQAVYVFKRMELPARVERVDLATGRRTFVRQLTPPDTAGVLGISDVTLSKDGASYAYASWQQRSFLFLVEGAR